MPTRLKVGGAYVLLLAALCLFGTTLVRATLYDPETEASPPAAVAASSPAISGDRPARLIIPRLGVDADVDALGLAAGERMQTPSSFTHAGWYKYGVAPGAPGVAVLYGHYNHGLGLDGIFHDLDTLRKGDDIQIVTRSGKRLHFIVDAARSYPYDEVPPEALGRAATDDTRLSLLTCAGDWVRDPQIGPTYDHRFVVRATYRDDS